MQVSWPKRGCLASPFVSSSRRYSSSVASARVISDESLREEAQVILHSSTHTSYNQGPGSQPSIGPRLRPNQCQHFERSMVGGFFGSEVAVRAAVRIHKLGVHHGRTRPLPIVSSPHSGQWLCPHTQFSWYRLDDHAIQTLWSCRRIGIVFSTCSMSKPRTRNEATTTSCADLVCITRSTTRSTLAY